jgi:transposase
MNDNAAEAAVAAHYGLLLGIQEPWKVKKAKLEMAIKLVDIEVIYDEQMAVKCPSCKRECRRYGTAPERTWRHLDVMQFETRIRAKVPRCECAEHGVLTLTPPWAEQGSRFTLMFEAFAIAVLLASGTVKQAAQLLGLDWDSTLAIMEKAVTRGLIRRSTDEVIRVGLDEKSFGKGQDYVSVMTDHGQRRVLEVVPARTEAAAVRLLESLPEEQLKKVEAVSLDMGAGFIAAVKDTIPEAKIVHDRFHVSKHLNEAVDKVRRDEHRRLLEKGDKSLTDTKFLWLQGAVVDGDKALSFEELCARDLKTAKAWAYKEMFVEFWNQPSAAKALSFFEEWFVEVMESKLEPLKKVAQTLQSHILGLLNYFDHKITNALAEGFNSRIQALKSAARGFRSFKNYRTRILFFCGKLDLAPAFH